MAYIPSLEETLSQLRQSVGLDRHPQEKRFSDFELNLENHTDIARHILNEMFAVLNMDEAACKDAYTGLMEWANFQKGLELNIWTGNASQQQVVWHLLVYSYAPALARRLAFWSLANTKIGLPPIDAGMPGGKFWFLPHLDKDTGSLEMPVTQVINWLLDLLGGTSVYSLKNSLGSNAGHEIDEQHVIRTLYNWHKKGVPKSSKKIDKLLSDNARLNFKGTFSKNNALSMNENFNAALDFVKRKHLADADRLNHEIPMSVDKLEAILGGNATDGDKEAFIEQIAIRYQIPTMRSIRTRLKIARMMQNGYKRLLMLLCPNIAEDCLDPAQNKLLQVIALFGMVYNLTIDATEVADSHEEQDAWFESKLAPWDKHLLISILPSQFQDGYLLVAERLTRIFMDLEADSPLEDYIPWNTESATRVIERRLSVIQKQHEEDKQLLNLRRSLRFSSPWRTLTKVNNLWVLGQLSNQSDLSPKIQDMLLKRMRELADTDEQDVSINVIELGYLLNGELTRRPRNIKQRVQQLLDESECSSGYEQWQTPLLRFRAKHHLFQNDLTAAIQDFKSALKACSDRAFGGLRGEIARDGFATELADHGFIPHNQEIYYRNLLAFTELTGEPPSFEDAAVECEEFFWDTLYQPYPDTDKIVAVSKAQLEAIFEETFSLILDADWEGLKAWLHSNAKRFRNKNIKEARRNSVFLSWLKVFNKIEQRLRQETQKFEVFLENWRYAMAIFLESWPEQAKIADFKGQTPLMLALDKGDIELTRLLLPLSDVNCQDYKGRSCFHSAVMGGNLQCLELILYSDYIDVLTTTIEGNTALHMAVRLGKPELVGLILYEFPGLSEVMNNDRQTALTLAKDIYQNYARWQKVMNNESRSIGSKSDFSDIISQLSVFTD